MRRDGQYEVPSTPVRPLEVEVGDVENEDFEEIECEEREREREKRPDLQKSSETPARRPRRRWRSTTPPIYPSGPGVRIALPARPRTGRTA